MTVQAEDKRFPVSGCHKLLPCCFSVSDILHFPNVMDLKGPLGRLAVFTLARVQSSEQLRSTERERENIGRDVHCRVVGCLWFKALELEHSDDTCLFLTLHGKNQSLFCFEPFDDFSRTCFVLVCQGFEQTSLPDVVEFVPVRLDIESQAIVVHQTSQFSVECDDNLSITLLC